MTAANGYLQLPEHCQFVKCEEDSIIFEEELIFLTKIYKRPFMFPKSDAVQRKDESKAKKDFVK